MRPPDTVTVGPHRYRIVVDVDGLLDGAGRCGQTARERLVISVDAGQAPSMLADTILHEIGHALLSTLGLSEAVEERVCLSLGPGLLALIRDNPQLVRYVNRSA